MNGHVIAALIIGMMLGMLKADVSTTAACAKGGQSQMFGGATIKCEVKK